VRSEMCQSLWAILYSLI